MTRTARVAATLGDVCGIGPEVLVRALATSPALRARAVVIGDPAVVRAALGAARVSRPPAVRAAVRLEAVPPAGGGALWVLDRGEVGLAALTAAGRLSSRAGAAAARWLDEASRLALAGRVAGIVTAPVNKAAVATAVRGFRGATEFLAARAGVREPVMMLAGPRLRVVPLTRHVPLARVPRLVTGALLRTAVRVTAAGLKRWYRIVRPRIAVCGLNPHAGEGGLLGREEGRVIGPAVRALAAAGYAVSGPWPADTLFAAAAAGRYDVVVGMYHDQALIPLKTVDGRRAVNVTFGLPYLRVSPAHGTAFDIAGRGRADPASMREALELAVWAATR